MAFDEMKEKFSKAVLETDIDLIRELIESEHGDINSLIPPENNTVLSNATFGTGDFVEKLIRLGADPNKQNSDGSTALTVALWSSNLDVAHILLDYGASVNYEKPSVGNTSLHLAAEHGHCDILVQLVKSADASQLNRFGCLSFTPLMYAVQAGHMKIAKLLLDLGADINACDVESSGNTALHIACETGRVDMVHFLLENGARTDIKGWMQMTPRESITNDDDKTGIKELLDKHPNK